MIGLRPTGGLAHRPVETGDEAAVFGCSTSSFGYAAAETPVLDALAARGVVFERFDSRSASVGTSAAKLVHPVHARPVLRRQEPRHQRGVRRQRLT